MPTQACWKPTALVDIDAYNVAGLERVSVNNGALVTTVTTFVVQAMSITTSVGDALRRPDTTRLCHADGSGNGRCAPRCGAADSGRWWGARTASPRRCALTRRCLATPETSQTGPPARRRQDLRNTPSRGWRVRPSLLARSHRRPPPPLP